MKLLRTIRLDPSDTFIFPSAAKLGEWAISGVFAFSDVELAMLDGKQLSAFRSGFLGVPSLGWSTLAQVVEADARDPPRPSISRHDVYSSASALPTLPPPRRPRWRKSISLPRSAIIPGAR
jgi:hypothetical protein